jgi:two-component system chemotaxis response regulator CheY
MKFLIVDDSATMRRIIANSLERIGFTDFSMAGDGVEALGVLNVSVDFIITDWNMPKMSGLDFVRAVRSGRCGERIKTIPIIMVTTRSVREDIIQAAEVGVNSYIVKPFTPQILKEKIDQVMEANQGKS